MKSSILNVLRVGAGGLLAASILTACADGRGGSGFRSRQFTAEERAFNKANRDAKEAANNPSKLPAAETTGEVPEVDSAGRNVLPPVDTAKASEPAKQAEQQQLAMSPALEDDKQYEGIKDEAKRKQLTGEMGQEPKETSVENLLVTNDNMVKAAGQKAIPEVAKLVKALSVKSVRTDKEVLLSVDAIVGLGAQDFGVHVQNEKLVFQNNGKVQNLKIKLVNMKDGKVWTAGNRLYVYAACADESCSTVQLKLSFDIGGGKRLAAVAVYRLSEEGATLVQSNFGTVKEFAAVQDDTQVVANPLANGAKQASAEEQAAAQKLAADVAAAKEKEAARLKAEADAADADAKAKEAEAKAKKDAAELPSKDAAAIALGFPTEATEKAAAEEAAMWAATGTVGQGAIQPADGAAANSDADQGTTDPNASTNLYNNVDADGNSTPF